MAHQLQKNVPHVGTDPTRQQRQKPQGNGNKADPGHEQQIGHPPIRGEAVEVVGRNGSGRQCGHQRDPTHRQNHLLPATHLFKTWGNRQNGRDAHERELKTGRKQLGRLVKQYHHGRQNQGTPCMTRPTGDHGKQQQTDHGGRPLRGYRPAGQKGIGDGGKQGQRGGDPLEIPALGHGNTQHQQETEPKEAPASHHAQVQAGNGHQMDGAGEDEMFIQCLVQPPPLTHHQRLCQPPLRRGQHPSNPLGQGVPEACPRKFHGRLEHFDGTFGKTGEQHTPPALIPHIIESTWVVLCVYRL